MLTFLPSYRKQWFHLPLQLLPYFSTPFCSKMLQSVIYIHVFHFPPSISPKPTTSWKPLTSKPPVISMLLILGVSSWSLPALASQQHSAQLLVPLETCSSLGSRTAHSWLSSHLAAACQSHWDICLTSLCFQSCSPICSPLTSRKTFPNPKPHFYISQWAQNFLNQCMVQTLSLYFCAIRWKRLERTEPEIFLFSQDEPRDIDLPSLFLFVKAHRVLSCRKTQV